MTFVFIRLQTSSSIEQKYGFNSSTEWTVRMFILVVTLRLILGINWHSHWFVPFNWLRCCRFQAVVLLFFCFAQSAVSYFERAESNVNCGNKRTQNRSENERRNIELRNEKMLTVLWTKQLFSYSKFTYVSSEMFVWWFQWSVEETLKLVQLIDYTIHKRTLCLLKYRANKRTCANKRNTCS